jgi:hypothetical protein
MKTKILTTLLAFVLLVGITACAGGNPNVTTDIPDVASEIPIEDAGLLQASDDWDAAYTATVNNWEYLQQRISESEMADTEFGSRSIKNPDALIAFEIYLQQAKTVTNEHDMLKKPDSLSGLKEDIATLNALASAYSTAADNLFTSQYTVEIVDPFNGKFDFTDSDGYSYHLEYTAVLPSVALDTTEGKPGEVGVKRTPLILNAAITNTTPGKKAPLPAVRFNLLYPDGQFSGVFDTLSSAGQAALVESSSGYLSWGKDRANIRRLYTFESPIPESANLPASSDSHSKMHGVYDEMASVYGRGPCYEYEGEFPYGFGTNPSMILDVDEKFEYKMEGMGAWSYSSKTRMHIVPENEADLIVQAITNSPVGIAFGLNSSIDSVAFSEPIFGGAGSNSFFNTQCVWTDGVVVSAWD